MFVEALGHIEHSMLLITKNRSYTLTSSSEKVIRRSVQAVFKTFRCFMLFYIQSCDMNGKQPCGLRGNVPSTSRINYYTPNSIIYYSKLSNYKHNNRLLEPTFSEITDLKWYC